MNSIKISIITVSYNSERTIRRTIESVLGQIYSPFEYIIVDGLSKDNTVKVAEEYRDRFRDKGINYRIISEHDNGIYDAMNKGIAIAEGELIGMINSDDWYERDALKIVADAYQNQHFDTMYADLNLVKANGTVILKKARIRNFMTTRDWNHPTMFVKKAVYDRFQYDINNLYADYDMYMKIRQNGYKVTVVNKPVANFATGGVSNEKSLKGIRKRIGYRYQNYRNNGYSRWYIFESIFMELAKALIA
ncbi:MAG: glycosyltransferase family 2 protein [Bacteroides sp.]